MVKKSHSNYEKLQVRVITFMCWGRGCDCMVVGFTTTYAISTTDVSSNLNQGEVYYIM